MKRNFILFLVCAIFTISCKKKEEKTRLSIYNFKVIDIYSGLPVSNAKVILRETNYPAWNKDTVIGYTNLNGEYKYICDRQSDHTAGNYSYSSIYFIGQNCTHNPYNNTYNLIEVTQTHETNDYTYKLLQSSTILIKTKRVSANPHGLGSNFCGFSVGFSGSFNYSSSASFYNDTLNQVHDTCFCCIPSNIVGIMKSCVLSSEYKYLNVPYYCIGLATDTINVGYNDTIRFNIEY